MPELLERERYTLGEDIDVVRRSQALLLFARGSGRTVRVSLTAAALLPMLQSGATFPQLREVLRQHHPDATDVEHKLRAFLRTLDASRVLRDDGEQDVRQRRRHRHPLFAADPIARVLAAPLRRVLPRPLGAWIAALTMLASIAAIGALAQRGQLPTPAFLAQHLDWRGLLVFFGLVMPLHELAHAVACRLSGVAAGTAGVLMHGGLVPGPYVETNQTYLLTDRWKRFAVPAAGPFVNLLAAGACAALLAAGGVAPAWIPAVRTVLFASLLFVFFDTNPFAASDGSHCIEALLEDELARRHALVPRPLERSAEMRPARRYRICMALHLALAVSLFAAWALR